MAPVTSMFQIKLNFKLWIHPTVNDTAKTGNYEILAPLLS